MDYKSRMQQIKRYSHYLRIVMNLFYWVAIVFAIGSIIGAIAIQLISDSFFVLNERNIGQLGFSLDGLIKYELNDLALQGANVKDIYFAISIMSALVSLLVIPVIRQIVLILQSAREDRPFAKENAKRISTIGVMAIMASFIIPMAECFVAMTMIATLEIQNVGVNYSVNIVLILTGFMMFILSGIFAYGDYLQHEYDETV